MNKPKLLVTHPLFEAPRLKLREKFDVELWTEPGRPARAEVLRRVADKEAVVCLLTEAVDAEFLAAAPKLRMVANVAVGFDNIDLEACTRRGVAASNTPGVLDETTADFAWTLLLAVARRLLEGDALARSGQWKGWNLDQLCGADVWGKTLGILGLGRIGQAVARRARGFGMRIVYNDAQRARAEVEQALGAEYVERDAVLAQADFLTLHVPLLPETRGLIGARELAKMKPTAYLINTSRGPVVSEAAIIAALENKTIAGAAFDVYEREPLIPDGLRRPNVVLAPHLASASLETRTKMAMIAAENVIALFEGRRPPNILNPEVLDEKNVMTLVTRNTPRLTLAGARAVLDAAEKRATEIGVPMNIAVVDDGGHLLAFARMDGAKLASVEIAIGKAICAAIRRQPTGPARQGDQVNITLSLGLAIASHGRQTPVRGGIPLIADGACIGAVGTSHGTEDQDTDVAQAGARAIEQA